MADETGSFDYGKFFVIVCLILLALESWSMEFEVVNF